MRLKGVGRGRYMIADGTFVTANAAVVDAFNLQMDLERRVVAET